MLKKLTRVKDEKDQSSLIFGIYLAVKNTFFRTRVIHNVILIRACSICYVTEFLECFNSIDRRAIECEHMKIGKWSDVPKFYY